MKALLCGVCFDIRALDPECAWTECRCCNMKARWVDPQRGTVKVKAKDRKRARIIGLNNSFLYGAFMRNDGYPPGTNDEWQKLHDEATAAPGYIFDAAKRGCWACIVEVGHTNDISWDEEAPT